MAAILKHSYNPERIKSFLIGDKVLSGDIVTFRTDPEDETKSESYYRSYLEAIRKGVVGPFRDGDEHGFWARIDPLMATLYGHPYPPGGPK